MFVECIYTGPIRSEAKPVHIEKALSLLGISEKRLNVAQKTISLVSRKENYQCSQAAIGQLCIVSYR